MFPPWRSPLHFNCLTQGADQRLKWENGTCWAACWIKYRVTPQFWARSGSLCFSSSASWCCRRPPTRSDHICIWSGQKEFLISPYGLWKVKTKANSSSSLIVTVVFRVANVISASQEAPTNVCVCVRELCFHVCPGVGWRAIWLHLQHSAAGLWECLLWPGFSHLPRSLLVPSDHCHCNAQAALPRPRPSRHPHWEEGKKKNK